MSKGCPVARTLASLQDRPQHVTLRARTDALLAQHSLERTGTLIGDLRAVVGFDDIRPHEIRTVLASMAPLYRTPPARCLFDHRSAAAYGAFMDSLPSFLGWTEFLRGLTLNRGWTELVHGRARRDLKQLVRRLAVSGLDDAQISQWQNDLRARRFPSSQLRDDDGFPWDGSEDNDYVEMACYGPQGVVLPSHVRLLLNETNGSSAAKEGYSTTTANVLKPLADWRLVSSVAAKICFAEAHTFFDGEEGGDAIRPPFVVVRAWRVPVVDTTDSWVEQAVVLSLRDGLFYYYNNSGEAFLAPSAFGSRAKKKIGTAWDLLKDDWGRTDSGWPSHAQKDFYGDAGMQPDVELEELGAGVAADRAWGDSQLRWKHVWEEEETTGGGPGLSGFARFLLLFEDERYVPRFGMDERT